MDTKTWSEKKFKAYKSTTRVFSSESRVDDESVGFYISRMNEVQHRPVRDDYVDRLQVYAQ